MNINQNRKKLYIPVNVPDSDDYISGIASFELAVLGISMVIALIAGGLIFSVSGNSVNAVAVAAIIITMTLITIRRDAYNENLIKKIGIVRKYRKDQKQFVYRYSNVYEGLNDGEDE